MNHLSPRYLVLSAVLSIMASAGLSYAQNAPPPRQAVDQGRPKLLQELGLSPEQLQKVREMNQTRKPLMEEAVRHMRDANRALDAAIYNDTLNEDDISLKLRDFQAAQAEVAKLRFQSELALRRILTPDQLTRFRTLRERFARAREGMLDRQQAPLRRRQMQRLRQMPR